MSLWLWQFWIYSFLGYLLEKGYAAATHAQRTTRKGFLLLPLCPVYGLGVLAVLALPPELRGNFWSLALWGGLTATAVEYAVHWWYERVLSVRFWDYTGLPGSIKGRVCLPFSVIWSLLLAVTLPLAAPALTPLLSTIPLGVTYAVLLVFTADAVLSFRLLDQFHDTEVLSLRRLLTD